MIFIDGTWLYYSLYERHIDRDIMTQKLGRDWQTEYVIDWSRLPTVACQALLRDKKSSWSAIMPVNNDHTNKNFALTPQQQSRPIEVSRVNVYSSMHRDTPHDSFRFQMFQNMMQAGFDVNMKETPAGRKGEKCVDIQLAVDMLYYATVPDAYDVALLLTGDRDFLPAVIRCRQKGRRIGLVSMRSASALAFEETPNLKDYDTIWLEDYIDQWARKITPGGRQQFSGSLKGTTAIHPPSAKRQISDYVITKVLSDFIAKSGEDRVSSRDVGRHLKDLVVGKRPLLKEVKEVFGGLYQFLVLSEVFVVEMDSRIRIRNFWVSNVPDAEISPSEDLSESEKEFLSAYKDLPEPTKEIAYEFTIADYDPNFSIPPGSPEALAEKFLNIDYSEFTVAELKDICRKNKLPVSGVKATLIKRIEDHMAEKKEAKNHIMDNVDPDRRLEMLVLEYLHATGGEASSRDVGRYLAANKASDQRLALEQGQRNVSALKEMKERYGSLLRFVERSELCNYYGKDASPVSHEFTVVAANDAQHLL
jgi:hypothetical protein